MTVTKQRDEEDESLLTTPNFNSSQQQHKPQKQQKSSEGLKMKRVGRERGKQKRAAENECHKVKLELIRHQIPRPQEDEQMLRPDPEVERERFPSRVQGIRLESEMEFMGYQTIVYVIFLMSAVVLIVADYGISDECQNLKRFNTVFFATAGSGFFIMMWTVLFRSLKPDCFVTSCSCFPLLLINLMMLAMCITLAAGELFNPICGEGWARGWLTMYWVSFVFIFPLIPLVVRYINGCYLYWYHLLIMQVVYVTHAMDVWIRGEDNVIPQYIPALTWFFIGSSAWVSTMYLTSYKYAAMLWVILGFCLVFLSADGVWRLGGPHGLEAQILLVVFNLLVTYVLCYRLWEALSPLIRKEEVKLSTDSEEDVEKIRLTLKASFVGLFKRSHAEHSRPIVKTRKSVWNSEWTLVNNEDDGERECPGPNRRPKGTDGEDGGVFEVETQILSDYDGSSDDEVRILIHESDEAPFSPRQPPAKPVKQVITLPESRGITQQQERWESNPLLSHKDETTNTLQATVPLLSTIATVTPREKDIIEESQNSERSPSHMKSVTPSKQVNFVENTTVRLTQSQDQLSNVSEGQKMLNKVRTNADGKVAEKESEDTR